MHLTHFDKLQQMVKESAELLIRLKFENRTLKKENENLKQEINNYNTNVLSESTEKIKLLERENKELKDKANLIRTRLVHLLDRIKSLSPGVES
jgi:FtsZ-binding cell division protein ZapB